MPETLDDMKAAKQGFSGLGIPEDHIKILVNPEFKEIGDIINELVMHSIVLKNKGKGVVLFCYAASHGQCRDGMQEIITNGIKPYPIEANLRNLAVNFYVVAMYDMCREKANALPTRGRRDYEDLLIEPEFEEGRNYIGLWGCAPKSTVPQKSTLCRSAFGHLRKAAKTRPDKGFTIVLPDDIFDFSGVGGNAEKLTLGRKITLRWQALANE